MRISLEEDIDYRPRISNDTNHNAVEDDSIHGLLSGEVEHSINSRISAKRIRRRLYVSHFLSTWNSRVFEFGAVLYLANIFPTTLLPMSIYAMVRGVSAIVFSSSIGNYIDRSERLSVVRLSIR
jgi:hypothetical protein